jgi:polysaccharide export outer membrane protein
LGSVQNPGKYPIESDSRLLDALVSAGGITLGGRTGGPAAAREMFVYRKIPADRRLDNMPIDPAYVSTLSNMSEEEREEGLRVLKEQGQYETISIPVSDAVSLGRFKYNILLQPDDIIYIPPAGSVIVRGWVNRPTLVSLGPSVHTLSHVLTLAGGLRFGGSSNVKVLRRSGDGEEITQIEVNARDMIALKLTDIPLRDGDEVYVPSQWFRATLEWFGGILNKGTNIGASATYNPI